MREILFRGKTEDGRWVEGCLVKGTFYYNDEEMTCIIPVDNTFYPRCEISSYEKVIPETVGQLTGCWDEDGIAIFEGDILLYRDQSNKVLFNEEPYIVKYSNTLAAFIAEDECENWDYIIPQEYKIIGNIHDNPELLKEA